MDENFDMLDAVVKMFPWLDHGTDLTVEQIM